MEIFNVLNYLYHEQEGLKQKYDTLIRLVSEVIEQLKREEIKVMNNSRVKVQKICWSALASTPAQSSVRAGG